MFKKETEIIVQCNSSAEREKLVSAIMTLRQFIIPSQGTVDLLTITVNS